jgi:hypothetical protein
MRRLGTTLLVIGFGGQTAVFLVEWYSNEPFSHWKLTVIFTSIGLVGLVLERLGKARG